MGTPSNSKEAVLLCTAGYDRTIRFWEALTGICSRTLQHPDSQVNRLAISQDKRFLAAAGNPHVRVYEALTTNPNHIASLEGHTANVTSVAFQHASKWLVTGSEDGTLKLWDLRARGPQRDYAHKSPVQDVVIHPNQAELISCDLNGSVKIWDLAGNACTHELVPEDDVPMRSVSIAADGSLLVAGNNKGNVYVWRMMATNASQLLAAKGNGAAAVVPEDELAWDLQPVTKIHAHNKYLLRCVLSPDVRHLATASADSTLKVWSIHAGNGSSASAGNGSVQRQSGTNGMGGISFKPERTLTGHQRWVWDCAFSADSEYLVSASSDHTSRLWDIGSGETIRQYQGHHKAITCIALNDLST